MTSSHTHTLAVLGAGSWGTALAIALANNGHEVVLWGRDPEAMQRMRSTQENARYLPGIRLPGNLNFSDNLTTTLARAEGVIIVTPTSVFVETVRALKPQLDGGETLVWACKGLESGSGRLLHEILAEELPETSAAILSGPSFAGELARGLPTAVTIAAALSEVAESVVEWFHGGSLRAYSSDDVVGVEVGGAVKNVYAIAAGISDGLGFGANARAALVTRSLAELTRLGIAMGARPETLMGLSGVGDLVLTCTDDQSRNRRLGLCLARGLTVDQSLAKIQQVVEGLKTTRDARLLAQKHAVDMPIVDQVYRVIYQGKPPSEAVRDLLARSPKAE